ncbi:MAG TPA: hypothetical protein VMU33_15740 [Burkholderiaceae bacterium]|nr:hypothetical protein [Burkholderiaceae bacterium]
MVHRALLAAMLITACSWATSSATPSTTPVAAAPVPAATGGAADLALAGERAATARPLEGGVASKAAIDRETPAEAPREWVLVVAGAFLIIAVSRRRRRSHSA